MWARMKQLQGADEVLLHRLVGRDTSGGHNIDIFEDEPEEFDAVIRPWQDDIDAVEETGQTGHTPGLKMYVTNEMDIGRNDRVIYNGGHFRVVNPQIDTLNNFSRYDLRTDERELRTESDVHDDIDLEEPDRDGYGDI